MRFVITHRGLSILFFCHLSTLHTFLLQCWRHMPPCRVICHWAILLGSTCHLAIKILRSLSFYLRSSHRCIFYRRAKRKCRCHASCWRATFRWIYGSLTMYIHLCHGCYCFKILLCKRSCQPSKMCLLHALGHSRNYLHTSHCLASTRCHSHATCLPSSHQYT